MAHRVGNFYQFISKCGIGGSGNVFMGRHILNRQDVAIKVECVQEEVGAPPMLPYEAAIYKTIGSSLGVPTLRWNGSEAGCNIIVLDKLGPDLERLKRFCCDKLSLKTVLMLADQMISRLQFVHSKGILYRDVKPSNFAMGTGRFSHVVHLFDFGLSKLYINPLTGEHIPFREGRVGLGTARFCSANVHMGLEQSRKDDMEGLGFTLLYLLRERLPWQGIYAASGDAKMKRLGEMKAGSALDTMLAAHPSEFRSYFEHCRSLAFEDRPDYDYLSALFRSVMEREGWQYDDVFDWTRDVDLPSGNLYPDKYISRPFEEIAY